jgi:hypothetical protein
MLKGRFGEERRRSRRRWRSRGDRIGRDSAIFLDPIDGNGWRADD